MFQTKLNSVYVFIEKKTHTNKITLKWLHGTYMFPCKMSEKSKSYMWISVLYAWYVWLGIY